MRIVVLGILALLSLTPFVVKMPGYSPFWLAMNNSAHALLFLVLTLGVAVAFKLPVSFTRKPLLLWAGLAGALLALGLSIEIVQPYVGRERSLEDLWLDVLGIGAGTAFYWAWHLARVRWLAVGAGLLCLALAAMVPLKMLKWQWNLYKQLPLVCNFESTCPGVGGVSHGSMRRANAASDGVWPSNKTRYGIVSYPVAPYPGVGLGMISTDWRGYSEVCADIYWPYLQASRIAVHIHDTRFPKQMIKFDESYELKPGQSTLCISLADVAKKVRLDDGKTLIYYRPAPAEAGEFYFDNVRLQ